MNRSERRAVASCTAAAHALCVVGLLLASFGAGAATPAGKLPRDPDLACTMLQGLKLADTTITLAQPIHPAPEYLVPATESAPGGPVRVHRAFCRVAATVKPAINFEVWMPLADWNNRFQGLGNGGWWGVVPLAGLAAAVDKGYAVAGTDTGHQSGVLDASWTMTEGRFNDGLAADWAHRGMHEMSVKGQAVVAAYYGQQAKQRYFVGCSSGGHQALTEAQRYPDDYDGILAGAPANYWTHLTAGQLWYGLATRVDPATNLEQPLDQLPRIHAAVLAACDRLDGVADGVLENPLACNLDAAALACKAGDAPGSCLAPAQATALQKIWGNAVGRDGHKVFPGLAPGSELGWPAMSAVQVAFAENFYRYFVFHDPAWRYDSLDFDRDVAQADATIGQVTNSTNADLARFRRHGGKLLQYHGWADPLISPYNSIDYYESVVARSGKVSRDAQLADTQAFHRLFMVPGMGHCAGGEGADSFDGLAALQSWVEQGKAPERIEAAHVVAGKTVRTRPLCPFPMQAVHDGVGNSDESASFRCAIVAAPR
jgi:feruloyl esterase